MNYELPFLEGSTVLQVEGVDLGLKGITVVKSKWDQVADVEKYDGLFTEAVSLASWGSVDKFLKACYATLKYGCYGVFFVSHDEKQGERGVTGRVAFSKQLIIKVLHDAGFTEICIVPVDESAHMIVRGYKSSLQPQPVDKILVKWNFGSFTVQYRDGWRNADIIDLGDWSKANGFNFTQMDVSKPLPMQDGSVDLIKCDHLIEHLHRRVGVSFLEECHRVLVDGGIIRIGFPDTKILASKYLEGRIMDFASINEGVKNARDSAEAYWNIATAGHVTFYDADSLTRSLMEAGFTEINMSSPGMSWSEAFVKETHDSFPELSCIVEARKTGGVAGLPVAPIGKAAPLNDEPIHRYLRGELREGVQ